MKTFVTLIALLLPMHGWAAKIPDPPQIDAKSYVLMDAATGDILAQHNADLRVEPASITKVLLSYVVYDEYRKGHASPDDEVLISEKAWRQGKDSSESRMFLDVGSRVRLGDLMNGIVIQSGNDASVAVAEHLAGSEAAFAELMNQYAVGLGMKNSNFTNAPGMPHPEHYTTAHDVALMGRALIRDFPEDYKTYSVRDWTYNGIKQGNRNILLDMDPGADGIKTGHTRAAGYCLLSSIKRDDRRLIAAVMGAKSTRARARYSLALMNWGFRFFDTANLLGPEKPIATQRIYKGLETQLPIGTLQQIALTLPRGAKDNLKISQQINTPIVAPINKGQAVGKVRVSLDGKVLREENLVALQDVPAGGLTQKISDQIRMWIDQ